MIDTTHLDALELRASNERGYIAQAKTQHERELRNVWLTQIEKEISDELAFLGMEAPASLDDISDDELLEMLTA